MMATPISRAPHPALRHASPGGRPRGVDSLSKRERQVLDAYIVHGDQRPIANDLSISLQTVKNYITSILDRIGEVARLLQISAASVYRRIDSGAIPAVRYGRSVRVPAWWVEEEGRKGHAA